MARYEADLPAVHCQGCFQSLAMAARVQKGIRAVTGEFPSTRVEVEYDEAETTVGAIEAWLTDAGYEPKK